MNIEGGMINSANQALFEAILDKYRLNRLKAKLIPKEIRRLSKINKIVKENDALKIIKKEGLEAAAVVHLFHLKFDLYKAHIKFHALIKNI